jgi:hypothetical protein
VKQRVTLLDGPCRGKPVRYFQPLPRTLVIADTSYGIRYHDYEQTVRNTEYRHSTHCPCEWRYPVNLDGIRRAGCQ